MVSIVPSVYRPRPVSTPIPPPSSVESSLWDWTRRTGSLVYGVSRDGTTEARRRVSIVIPVTVEDGDGLQIETTGVGRNRCVRTGSHPFFLVLI